MTVTFDVFRYDRDGEATVLVTGFSEPPSVVNVETAEEITLEPAKIDHTGGWTSRVAILRGEPLICPEPIRGGAWWGTLAIGAEAGEARFEVRVGEDVFRPLVRWPEQPASAPKPKRRRKARS